MLNKKSLLLTILLCSCCSLAVMAQANKTTSASLTAEQIADRNTAARGGITVWRAVQTMSWGGKMQVGGGSLERNRTMAEGRGIGPTPFEGRSKGPAANAVTPTQQVELPFVLDMKRPGKSRVEIEFAGKTAVQVYDGTNGWKVRPFLNRNEVEPFTPDEVKAEQRKPELDGPLVDYAAKGTKVQLEGVEAVNGHNAYKLKLTTRIGTTQHIWIDTQSFLDVKVEGQPRRMDGKMRTVWIYQSDFRSVQGLVVPFVLESAVEGYPDTHKMFMEKVEVNPKLDDTLFVKPKV